MVLTLAAFMTAGYVTTSFMTSRNAEAYLCPVVGYPCVQNSGTVLLNIVAQELLVDTGKALLEIELKLLETMGAVGLLWTSKVELLKQTYSAFFRNLWNNGMAPAYRAMTRQLHVRDTEQIAAIHKFHDAMEMNRAILEKQLGELQDHRENRASEQVCVTGTIASHMTRANLFTKSYGAAAASEKLPRSASSAAAPAARSPGSDMSTRFKNYQDNYCNSQDNNGNAGCTADGALLDRDIDVTGEIFAKDTIDIVNDADTNKVITDLITNLSEPFLSPPISPDVNANDAAKQAFLDNEKRKARRQAIYDLLYWPVARRLPGSVDVAGGAQNYLGELRNAARVDPSMISPNPSKNEIMNVMMAERFRDGKFGVSQIDEPENNEKEMVTQRAFQLMQMSEMLDLLDRYSIVLAAQTGDNINQYKAPRADNDLARPQ